eukprot:8520879-Pyramimonas_sp.AAC.1
MSEAVRGSNGSSHEDGRIREVSTQSAKGSRGAKGSHRFAPAAATVSTACASQRSAPPRQRQEGANTPLRGSARPEIRRDPRSPQT